MKKFAILLAVLFTLTVSYSFACDQCPDPVTDQATVTVQVYCPLTFCPPAGDISTRLVAGCTSNFNPPRSSTFRLQACPAAPGGSQAAPPAGTHTPWWNLVHLQLSVQPAATNDGKVQLSASWQVDGDGIFPATPFTPVIMNWNNFNGYLPIYYRLHQVHANADANTTQDYVWALNVQANYYGM